MAKLNREVELGASAVEYGLIVVAIAAVITAIGFILGHVVQDTYSGSCTKIANEASTATAC
jgi:pilus assembly protein Flp/PilA